MNDIFNTTSLIEHKKDEKYRDILRNVMIKISLENKKKKVFTIIEIPMTILNMNTYNIKIALSFVMKYLRNNDIRVKYNYPNILIISWKHLIDKKKKLIKFTDLIPKKDKYNRKTLIDENMEMQLKTSYKKNNLDKDLEKLDKLFN